MAQMRNNLPAMWEAWVQSLAREDSLEEGVATHSSILAWRIPWTEEPGRVSKSWAQLKSLRTHTQTHQWKKQALSLLAGYSPWGHKELDMTAHARTIILASHRGVGRSA